MTKRSWIFIILMTAILFSVNQYFTSKRLEQERNKHEIEQKAQKEIVETTQEKVSSIPSTPINEQSYYVLENSYLQLVFTNAGGTISEINLPFKSKENKESVVRPINFDREIQKESPANAKFPLFPYERIENNEQTKKEPTLGGYYPLLRRTILESHEKPQIQLSPSLYCLNILSKQQEKPFIYQVKRFEKNLIEFEATENNRRITKTFSLPENPDSAPYVFDLSVKIDGSAKDLYLTSGVPEVELISGSYSPTIKYRIIRGQKSSIEKISLPKNVSTFGSIHPNWICNSNGFFGIIVDPLTEIGAGFQAKFIPGNIDPTRLILVDPKYHPYHAEKYPGYSLQLPLRDSTDLIQFRVYAGPFASDILKRVDTTFSKGGYNPNYIGAQSFHGWFAFISEPFAKFLFLLMKFFYKITNSWGLSIILLTIALRIMLYPLNTWSIRSTLKMQQIQPKVTAIQEKFKKDPRRMQMEVMQLYRQEKVNPFTGCLPLLIQMPFLIGMFDLLKSNFDLRGASFIPGWINNLTAPDVIFSWGYPIPFIGTEFHLLPILLGIVMYFQQRLSMKKNVKAETDQQKQQKMMGNIFTVVFTVLFYNLPSGLNIYFLSSMGLQFLQQWYMAKKMKPVK